MSRKTSMLSFGLLLAAFAGAAASAQCRFSQPWDGRHAAHMSLVRSCDNPEPLDLAATDDFICRSGGRLTTIRWWGTLDTGAQIGRRYYVAIRKDNGNCQPGELLYETCVVPRVAAVGVDCEFKRVFSFTTPVAPFPVNPGERYWLQISESDADSARPGVEDFRWSGRQPVRMCPAGQIVVGGGFIQPLIDPCDGGRDDLSFALRIQ